MCRKIAEMFNKLPKPEHTVFYLAAAVSDFYIPFNKMVIDYKSLLM